MSIYTKLFEIQKQNLLLTADAENPFYKNKYISIENIMKTFKPLLEQQKILLYHIVTGDSVSTYVRDIEDSDGEPVVSIFPLNSSLDAQKKGAEITYGKRYNLVALFCVVEDDDDGNFASGKTAVAKASYTSTPQGTSYATKSAVEEKADWVNEKEVDKLFDDMIDGTLPLASGPTRIIMEYRNAKKRAVSKKVAGYIEEQYVSRIDNIGFGQTDKPITTKDGVQVPF